MLGIIGAMEEEVEKLKNMLVDVQIISKAGMNFYKGFLDGKEVMIVKCGIGKVNAAICTQTMIDMFPISGIINTGIAGSLDAGIDIGDIVFSTDTVEHDMDVSALGYEPGIIPDAETSIYVADSCLRTLAIESVSAANLQVKTFCGRVVSGDQFISDQNKKKWLTDTFGGVCTEMEGAAIAHTAYMNQIPFLIVRAISDKADDSAEMDYPTFAKQAITNSVKMMVEIIHRYHESE